MEESGKILLTVAKIREAIQDTLERYNDKILGTSKTKKEMTQNIINSIIDQYLKEACYNGNNK